MLTAVTALVSAGFGIVPRGGNTVRLPRVVGIQQDDPLKCVLDNCHLLRQN
jgi:enoyl-CoA hydratase/carnithine racemase